MDKYSQISTVNESKWRSGGRAPRVLVTGEVRVSRETAAGAHWVTGRVGHRVDVNSLRKRNIIFPSDAELRLFCRPALRVVFGPTLTDCFISGGINKLNYKRETRRKTHCAYFKTLWLMEHQVSRTCYVSWQAKVRMSHCTDRPNESLYGQTAGFCEHWDEFLLRKAENLLTSWPTISFQRGILIHVPLLLTYFVCS